MTLLRGARAGTFENPTVPLTHASLVDWLAGPRVHSGARVTEKGALGIPAVFRAVALLGGSIGSLPIHAYRESETGVPQPAGPRSGATQLLKKPADDMTPFELLELIVCHMALWGNAYLRILRDQTDTVRELWPLMPSEVMVGRGKDGKKVYRVASDRDKEGVYRAHTDETILHIPGIGYDGICGCSPIRMARQGIGLALAAEEYGARLFGSGSLASGILQTEQRLTPEQADALKDRWKAKAQGLSHAHEAVVLDRGAKFQALSIPPEDAQFIESRRFQIAEVARLYGIPPHMLMDMERSTSWGTGIEQQSIGFVKYTLRPWLTRIEQRISTLWTQDTVYAKFVVEGLLRGDSQARAQFYRTMWEIGAFSTNEIRALEEQPPVEGGDVHYRPMNMGKLGEFSEEGSEEPAPAPQPAQEGATA